MHPSFAIFALFTIIHLFISIYATTTENALFWLTCKENRPCKEGTGVAGLSTRARFVAVAILFVLRS